MDSKDAEQHRILKKKLLHYQRHKLVKQLRRCEQSNVLNSSTYGINGSKNDLISRIIKSIASQKKNKERKNNKKKATNRKPITISNPIYNNNELNHNKRTRKRKLSPYLSNNNNNNIANASIITVKKKKKRKLKPKSKPKQKSKNVQKYIYKIINMRDRPYVNGKHCKIISKLNNNHCRVRLINNGSEQVLSMNNLEKITAKHRRQKAISVNKIHKKTDPDFSDVTIKDSMSLIKSFEVNNEHYFEPLAIGVFVDYQMILKLFINTHIQYLFGTKYKTFKTQCLLFLDENDLHKSRNSGCSSKHNYKIIDNLFIMLYYKCYDKQMIFLMRNNKDMYENPMGNITAVQAMDLSLMYACNVYKNMPSSFDIIKQAFKISDKYGFGEITKKEFNRFLSSLAGKTNITSSSSALLFDKIDKDKIKAITFNQFAKYMIENKKILWELLLELAADYKLKLDFCLILYQNTLSKIHKLLLIMDEMIQMYQMYDMYPCFDNKMYQNKMIQYIQFIMTNQMIIDDKIIEYKKNNTNKCKTIEKVSSFIHNTMPNIDL